MDTKLKKRKLLFQQIITCPNNHEVISNVYEDNGYFYYECPICNVVIGLQTKEIGYIEPRSKRVKINKKVTNRFTGFNAMKIQSVFIKRSEEEKRK